MKAKEMLLLVLVCMMDISRISGKWCTRLRQRPPDIGATTNQLERQQDNTTEIERYCCEGYYLNGNDCVSFCKEPCQNGFCKDTGECVCYPGYTLDHIKHRCLPSCDVGCENGDCLEPSHICKCHKGYKFHAASKKCQPVCESQCSADAKDPDTHSPGSYRNCHQICKAKCKFSKKCFSPGNVMESPQESISTDTESFCTPNCGYGECFTPGSICQCHDGYQLNNITGLCEPRCPKKCPSNSTCVQPNVCRCHKGHIVDPLTKNRCKSLKRKIFSYSGSLTRTKSPTIMERMKLLCEKGFEYNETLLRCQPTCHNGCLNGNCTSTDVCVCWQGYSLDAITHSCKANPCNTPCPNGYCIPDGDCVCPEGLTRTLFRSTGCEPLHTHTMKVVGIFICVITVMAFIIWLITVAERRRRRF